MAMPTKNDPTRSSQVHRPAQIQFRRGLGPLAFLIAFLLTATSGWAQAGWAESSELETIEIQVGDLTFNALAAGPPEGDLVLLLHGFPQTAYSWRHQLSALAAAGYRAVAPNQRGYSPGARPPGVENYVIALLAQDVADMADALRADRFHLVGHDWGGAVAWVTAARFPDRLASLSVLSTPHFLAFSAALADPESEQNERSSYFADFSAEGAEEVFLANDAAQLRGLFGEVIPKSAVDEYVAVLGNVDAMEGALNWYRALSLSTPPPGNASSSTTSTSPPPTIKNGFSTLYVWGTEDSAFARETAEATRQFAKAPYRFEALEGIGHWIAESATETVNSLILENLDLGGKALAVPGSTQHQTANTLQLGTGMESPEAAVSDLQWLAGYWKGKSSGGQAEEIWMPPSSDTMTGAFKFVQEGRVLFYEFLELAQEDGVLSMRLKHFDPKLDGWEKGDEHVSFPLVKLEERAAYFSGLTYKLVSDSELHVFVAVAQDEGDAEEMGFVFFRQPLP